MQYIRIANIQWRGQAPNDLNNPLVKNGNLGVKWLKETGLTKDSLELANLTC